MENIHFRIKKGKLKEYLKLGIYGGIIPGLIFFGVALLEKRTLSDSLSGGFVAWVVVILLFVAGFFIEEYIKPKQLFKRVHSNKYSFLLENKFVISEDYTFEGQYKGFWFRVYPMTFFQNTKKNIDYDLIQAFYTIEGTVDTIKKEQDLCGDYFLGRLIFSDNNVIYLPKDWREINFKENFEELIIILNREKLYPLSIKKWEEEIGAKMEYDKRKDIEERTKQIVKIGNFLDIKYIKPQK